jgi:hypothetical protein
METEKTVATSRTAPWPLAMPPKRNADIIYLELTTQPDDRIEPKGVDTPLVVPEGYPRSDIESDVYRARTLRNRFRILQTDHKEISPKIDGL